MAAAARRRSGRPAGGPTVHDGAARSPGWRRALSRSAASTPASAASCCARPRSRAAPVAPEVEPAPWPRAGDERQTRRPVGGQRCARDAASPGRARRRGSAGLSTAAGHRAARPASPQPPTRTARHRRARPDRGEGQRARPRPRRSAAAGSRPGRRPRRGAAPVRGARAAGARPVPLAARRAEGGREQAAAGQARRRRPGRSCRASRAACRAASGRSRGSARTRRRSRRRDRPPNSPTTIVSAMKAKVKLDATVISRSGTARRRGSSAAERPDGRVEQTVVIAHRARPFRLARRASAGRARGSAAAR